MRALAFAALPFCAALPLALLHCGTDAVGVEACRQIEDARCEALRPCGVPSAGTPPGAVTDQQVEACKLYYRDQCLHGLQNTLNEPQESEITACVAAIAEVGACAQNGVPTMADCPNASLAPGADPATAPCTIVLSAAEKLAACAFVVQPPLLDAGTSQADTGASDASSD